MIIKMLSFYHQYNKILCTDLDLGHPFYRDEDRTERCVTIGIKHDFLFINIRKVPMEMLKTEGEEGGVANVCKHLPREFANVNE